MAPAAAQDEFSHPAAADVPASQPAWRASVLNMEDLDNATDLLDMKVPPIVAASRRAQSIDSLPYAFSVITREDIRRSGARSIADALRLAPGTDVAELSANNAGIGPRGFHGFVGRTSQVLVDGRQQCDAFFGGCVWSNWPLQVKDIERIEIIRGPGGAIWGANAANGVINIVTRDPRDQTGLTVIGGGGSRGVNKEHSGYGFTDEKLRVRVSGEHDASGGFVRGGSWLRSFDDGYLVGRLNLHAIYEPRPADPWMFSGFETEARYRATDELTLLGNYTYQVPDWRSSVPPYFANTQTPPTHKSMVGARYDPLPDLHLHRRLYFVDDVDGPNPVIPFLATEMNKYFRLDLQAGYEFWDQRASVAVGVRNLLDSSHPEGTSFFMNTAETPRMVFAELRMRLP